MRISEKEITETVATWRALGNSRKKTAEALSLKPGAVQRRLQAAERETSLPESSEDVIEKVSVFDPRFVRLQDENAELKRELKLAARDNLDADKVRREIIGIAGHSPNPPAWTFDTQPESHPGPGTPMVMWSDWHWGETVRPEEVGGVNAFNLEIAHARLRRAVELIIRLAFDHQVHSGYPGLVLSLNGDIISGEIHQELADTNELKTIPTVVDVFNALITAITTLADRFGKIFIPCIVGNHGRNTLKPRCKSRVYTSYEWLLYVMLEKFFAGDARVQFFVPGDIDALVRVNNTRYMFTHGDALGTKGGDGIIGALGPIMRGAIKTAHSNAQVGRDYDVLCIGHWHQYLPLPSVIVNGSLKGYDEFARTILRASYQRPIQAMWYDHPKIGITKHEPLYLEGLRVPDQVGGWVSWTA